jgi:hypothetical protein
MIFLNSGELELLETETCTGWGLVGADAPMIYMLWREGWDINNKFVSN